MENYNESLYENEEDFCPLCCEEMDITDKNFKPCPCGYQICQFCYNNIRTNPDLNGKCPACRRLYDDESVEYTKMTAEEFKMYHHRQEKKKKEKKEQEKQKREAEIAKRHHLANMRVIQKNLVYVLGLNPNVPYEELPQTLKSERYFGRFGKINKVVINRRTQPGGGPSTHINSGYSVYVTFAKKEDASKCIESLDGAILDDRVLKAAHGTTKYCSSYLRGQQCQNPNCMFLHEPGEEADSYNRESRSTPKPFHIDSNSNSPIVQSSNLLSTSATTTTPSSAAGAESLDITNGPALPSTVSWAAAGSAAINHSNSSTTNIESFPTLGTFVPQQQQPLQQQQQQQHQYFPSQQQQYPQHLSASLQQQQLQLQAKKKDKKDSDKKQQMLDDTMAAFKLVSDNLKTLNSGQSTGYMVNPRFMITSHSHLFHPIDISSFQDRSCGYMTDAESRARLFKLTDAFLYSGSSKNYNYRSCLEPRQTAPVPAPAPLPVPIQNPNTTANRLNTASFLQQRLQQQQLKALGGETAKANTQELLSQLTK